MQYILWPEEDATDNEMNNGKPVPIPKPT